MKITSRKTCHQNGLTIIFHFQALPLAKSWWGSGAFSPFKINPGKSKIIRALNSSIKVKIRGEDLYFWRNSLIQALFWSQSLSQILGLLLFFLATLITVTSDRFWLHLCKWRNIRVNCVPLQTNIVSYGYVSCTISAILKLNFSSYLLQYTFSITDYIDCVFFNLYLFKVSSKSTFSLVFWDLPNIDLFFTFLSIDSQHCSYY